MRRKFAIIAGVGAFLVLTGFVMSGVFASSSICHHCGASQSARRWFIPGTTTCYLHTTSVRATPVSNVLETTGVVAPHEHDWQMAHGSGNGIFCAIGQGRHLSGAVNSENVAAIISAANRFGDTVFRDKIVKALLDPKTSHSVFYLGNRVKTDSFTTRENFHAWLAEESASFSEALAMAMTE
jgi:hypothetical protein